MYFRMTWGRMSMEKWSQNGAIFVNSARPNMSKTKKNPQGIEHGNGHSSILHDFTI